VVFTGLSGSGKSSLAFDTIYARGSAATSNRCRPMRASSGDDAEADVDQIDGLSPAISIEQKTTSKNPRSTVGTVTEIYDYMRLLWARVGVPYSPATGLPIESQTVSQMVDRVLALPGHPAVSAGAGGARPQGRVPQGTGRISEKGISAGQDRRQLSRTGGSPTLDKKFPHDIDVVVDRIRGAARPRAAAGGEFETALKLAEGLAVIEYADAPAAAADERKSDKKTAKIHDKSGPERMLFFGKIRLPGVRVHRFRRSSRGCSPSTIPMAPARPAGASARAACRRRTGHPRQGAHLRKGADRALGEIVLAPLHPDPDGAR